MAKGYSKDLRERAVAMVEEGDSRREVARVLNLAPSTKVCWLDRWTTTGSVEAKPGTGHSRSPLKAHGGLHIRAAFPPGRRPREMRPPAF
jgi:transposase